MKNQETPIYQTLLDYLSKAPIRMHVPFHTGFANNNILPKEIYNLDISEVSGYDIEGEDNPLFQSETITADFFSVYHSFYLTGGASAGLLASMIALRKYGKKVVLARNVHKSVINGVILAGLEPVWLDVDFLNEWGIFSSVNPESLEKVLSSNNDIAGVVLVSPTYEGVISDIKMISDICHSSNIPLIVDEAHGGHLWFVKDLSCSSAINCTATLVIQSWHKSLGSLTQTGVLHLVNDKFFSYRDIKRSLDLVSSTSPSFPLLLSLELTRKDLAIQGIELFNALYEDIQKFRSELSKINGISLFKSDDLFKVYLKSQNQSGIDFAYHLYEKYSIEIESANEKGLLILAGMNFDLKRADSLINSINNIQLKFAGNKINHMCCNPSSLEFEIFPRKAFMLGFKEENQNELKFEVEALCPPGYVTHAPGVKSNK